MDGILVVFYLFIDSTMVSYQRLKMKAIVNFRRKTDSISELGEEECDDVIFFIVDDLVPTQHHKILKLALTNLNLVYAKPSGY